MKIVHVAINILGVLFFILIGLRLINVVVVSDLWWLVILFGSSIYVLYICIEWPDDWVGFVLKMLDSFMR